MRVDTGTVFPSATVSKPVTAIRAFVLHCAGNDAVTGMPLWFGEPGRSPYREWDCTRVDPPKPGS